ncbi:kinase-like protein [Ceratobasidium sp. AG-I]|nr:kinase-like protein [Ceratobasidium sp. AG-I]
MSVATGGTTNFQAIRTDVKLLHRSTDKSLGVLESSAAENGSINIVYIPVDNWRSVEGTPNVLSRLSGPRIVAKIIKAYLFIAEHYRPGDLIYLSGYSSGAFVVHKVAYLISQIGLVSDKGKFFQIWQQRGSPVAPPMRGKDIPIEFLIVWDNPNANRFKPNSQMEADILGVAAKELPTNVRHALHAVNQYRKHFVALFQTNCVTDLKEAWFPGSHLGVGRNISNQTGLRRSSFVWVMDQLIRTSNLPHNKTWHDNPVCNSLHQASQSSLTSSIATPFMNEKYGSSEIYFTPLSSMATFHQHSHIYSGTPSTGGGLVAEPSHLQTHSPAISRTMLRLSAILIAMVAEILQRDSTQLNAAHLPFVAGDVVMSSKESCSTASLLRSSSAAREIHAWSKCDHPNVLGLLGIVEFRGQIGMVSHWMNEGNLVHYLQRERSSNRPNICLQVADGLSYLHQRGIVHGDLKGANILVSDSGIPLLTDFGNSTLQMSSLQFTSKSTDRCYTLRWTAPELLTEKGPANAEADIYAFGMTILEIITGCAPYAGWGDMAVMHKIIQGIIPERPENHLPRTCKAGEVVWELLKQCWARSPKSRPTAINVRDTLENIGPADLPFLHE